MLERGGDRGVVLLRFLDDDELELAENALPAEDTDPALVSEEDQNELTLGDRHQQGPVSGRAEKAPFHRAPRTGRRPPPAMCCPVQG